MKAEVVEDFAHCHGTDGMVGVRVSCELCFLGAACTDANLAALEVGGVLLQDDFVADPLNDRSNGVAKPSQRLTREAAGAGFAAEKCARVQQKDTSAGAGEIVGGGTARGTGADDQDIGRRLHGYFGA